MRKALALGTAAASLGALALAAPASAAAGDTVATFTLAAGSNGLSVSVPVGTDAAPVDLGSAEVGSATVSGALGGVTVTDTRGALVAAWTATVSATDFKTGGGTTNETVAKALIRYTSNAPLVPATGQVGVVTPGTAALTMGAAGTAATFAGVGNNTVSWTPTLSFTLLPSQVAGVYKGTITHSVV